MLWKLRNKGVREEEKSIGTKGDGCIKERKRKEENGKLMLCRVKRVTQSNATTIIVNGLKRRKKRGNVSNLIFWLLN